MKTIIALGRWSWHWTVALTGGALLLFAVSIIVGSLLYWYDRAREEIYEEGYRIAYAGPERVILHLWGKKRRGLPLVLWDDRPCPSSGTITSAGVRVDCAPGDITRVRLSPVAYGVRADNSRRIIAMSGGEFTSYPDGAFDAGLWRFDTKRRWPGDPPIVAIDLAVVHEGWFGPREEVFDRFELLLPPSRPIPSAPDPLAAHGPPERILSAPVSAADDVVVPPLLPR